MTNPLDTINRKFVQFSLWKNCSNGCSFCCNKGFKPLTNEQKIQNLKYVISMIQSNFIDSFNEIGFIGGEFFNEELDNAEVKQLFIKIFEILSYRKHIDKIYIATSLMFDIHKHLLGFISELRRLNLLQLTLFCTSYDTKYRFNTPNSLLNWENNVKYIKNIVGKVHIETILTHDFITKILTNQISIVDLENRYESSFDYIEPSFIEFYKTKEKTIQALPDFLPTRKEFLDFVKSQCITSKILDINRLLAIQLRPNTLVHQINGLKWVIEDDRWINNIRRTDSHGNVRVPGSYSDSSLEMYDDLKTIKHLLGDM